MIASSRWLRFVRLLLTCLALVGSAAPAQGWGATPAAVVSVVSSARSAPTIPNRAPSTPGLEPTWIPRVDGPEAQAPEGPEPGAARLFLLHCALLR